MKIARFGSNKKDLIKYNFVKVDHIYTHDEIMSYLSFYETEDEKTPFKVARFHNLNFYETYKLIELIKNNVEMLTDNEHNEVNIGNLSINGGVKKINRAVFNKKTGTFEKYIPEKHNELIYLIDRSPRYEDTLRSKEIAQISTVEKNIMDKYHETYQSVVVPNKTIEIIQELLENDLFIFDEIPD